MKVYFDRRFALHEPEFDAPDDPNRAFLAMAGLDGVSFQEGAFGAADPASLATVHSAHLVQRLLSARGTRQIIDETALSPSSVDAALVVAGASIAAAHTLSGGESAYVLSRPPGHNACRDRLLRGSIVNFAALAANTLAEDGARVAIVDFDAHRGWGTQDIFWTRSDVLVVDLHRDEPGELAGRSGVASIATVDLALCTRAGDREWHAVWTDHARAQLRRFAPDAIVISAGFDALTNDPVGGMQLSIGQLVEFWADCTAICRSMAVLEGGYDPVGLEEGVRRTAEVLAAQ